MADPVDLALVLAFDASASVDPREFLLILGGTAEAFRAPEVAGALPAGGMAAAATFWSGRGAQEVAVAWQVIRTGADAAAFADAIENAPRTIRPGATALGEALRHALALLARAPFAPARAVIDVAGDGRSNAGIAPAAVRDAAAGAGVGINGLAILDEEPDLLDHYTAEVITGPAAFAMAVASYDDFAVAMRRKLVREIAARGIPPRSV